MIQATDTPVQIASTEARQLAGPRAAYKRANAVAQRVVDRLTSVMPNAVELCRGLCPDLDTYGIRLHFGLGLVAGRGVLEVAALADAQVTRDPIVSEAWIECRTLVEGVPLVARALLSGDDADQLLSTEPAAPAPEQAATDQATPVKP